jgi:hypothetical protein
VLLALDQGVQLLTKAAGGVGAELGRRTDGGPGGQRRATDPACSAAVADRGPLAFVA